VESHVYRPDIAIGFAFGLSTPDDSRSIEGLILPIRPCTPHSLIWNGSLVDRLVRLVVDGGRAKLPFPHGLFASTGPMHSELVADQVTREEVATWRLVNALGGTGHEFDSYLDRGGFVVVAD